MRTFAPRSWEVTEAAKPAAPNPATTTSASKSQWGGNEGACSAFISSPAQSSRRRDTIIRRGAGGTELVQAAASPAIGIGAARNEPDRATILPSNRTSLRGG